MATTSEPACHCDCAAGALHNEALIKLVICAGLALLLACLTRPLREGPSRFSHATWVSACFVATAALLWTAASTAEMPVPPQLQQGDDVLFARRRKRLVVAATVTGVFMAFATVISWILGAIVILDKKDAAKKAKAVAAGGPASDNHAPAAAQKDKDKESKQS